MPRESRNGPGNMGMHGAKVREVATSSLSMRFRSMACVCSIGRSSSSLLSTTLTPVCDLSNGRKEEKAASVRGCLRVAAMESACSPYSDGRACTCPDQSWGPAPGAGGPVCPAVEGGGGGGGGGGWGGGRG